MSQFHCKMPCPSLHQTGSKWEHGTVAQSLSVMSSVLPSSAGGTRTRKWIPSTSAATDGAWPLSARPWPCRSGWPSSTLSRKWRSFRQTNSLLTRPGQWPVRSSLPWCSTSRRRCRWAWLPCRSVRRQLLLVRAHCRPVSRCWSFSRWTLSSSTFSSISGRPAMSSCRRGGWCAFWLWYPWATCTTALASPSPRWWRVREIWTAATRWKCAAPSVPMPSQPRWCCWRSRLTHSSLVIWSCYSS